MSSYCEWCKARFVRFDSVATSQLGDLLANRVDHLVGEQPDLPHRISIILLNICCKLRGAIKVCIQENYSTPANYKAGGWL